MGSRGSTNKEKKGDGGYSMLPNPSLLLNKRRNGNTRLRREREIHYASKKPRFVGGPITSLSSRQAEHPRIVKKDRFQLAAMAQRKEGDKTLLRFL